MNFNTLLPCLFIYTAGAASTFGLFYRDHQNVPMGPKQAVAVIVWPIWWLVAKGLGGIFDAIDHVAYATEGRRTASLAFGLFAAGHHLASAWGGCVGTAACSGAVLTSAAMYFPPFSFIYVIWLALQSLLQHLQ